MRKRMTLTTPTRAGRSKEARARKQSTAGEYSFSTGRRTITPLTRRRHLSRRIRCAKELADAETVGQRLGYEFEWDFDECPDLSWMSDEEREQEHEVLCCRIVDPENSRYSLASSSGRIAIIDDSSNMRNWRPKQSQNSTEK